MSDIVGPSIQPNQIPQEAPGIAREVLGAIPLVVAAGVGFVALEVYAHSIALTDRISSLFSRD